MATPTIEVPSAHEGLTTKADCLTYDLEEDASSLTPSQVTQREIELLVLINERLNALEHGMNRVFGRGWGD